MNAIDNKKSDQRSNPISANQKESENQKKSTPRLETAARTQLSAAKLRAEGKLEKTPQSKVAQDNVNLANNSQKKDAKPQTKKA